MFHPLNFVKRRWLRLRDASIADKVRVSFIVFMQLGLLVAFVLAFYERAWLTLFVSALALGVVWMPSILARNFHVHFPLEFEFLLNVFVYGSIFLGTIHGYYTKFWWWDTLLHATSGIALGFLGFLILYSLYRDGRFSASPFLLAFFSFSFALALGAMWEIIEFTLDSIFGFNLQGSGLLDTMGDLIVDTLGAFIAALSGYVYVRYHRRGVGIFQHYLDAYFGNNPS